jgi:hypothetical protein
VAPAPGPVAPAPIRIPPRVDPAADKNRSFVQRLYQDLLGHPADASALAQLTMALGQGASRDRVVRSVTGSDEYAALRAQQVYLRTLHHPPDAAATASMVAFLRGGGTEEQVIAVVAGSDEYFQLAGRTNAGFVDRLYADLLGRPASAAERVQLVMTIERGATRANVAQTVLAGDEYARNAVQSAYQTFLRRPADAAAIAALRAPFAQGGSRVVIIVVCASPEYYART